MSTVANLYVILLSSCIVVPMYFGIRAIVSGYKNGRRTSFILGIVTVFLVVSIILYVLFILGHIAF